MEGRFRLKGLPVWGSLAIAAVLAACLIGFLPRAHAASLQPEAFVDTAASATSSVGVAVAYGQTEARSMLAMINSFRTGSDAWVRDKNGNKESRSGLSALAYDYELERVAKLRAAEIALSYSHTRPDGSSKAWDAFDGWQSVGENIAAGYTSAKSVFEGWQETNEPYAGQGHRRNMLSSNFSAVGIGHVVCNGCHYWVQEFCSPVLDTTATAADNSKRVVKIDVADSVVTKRAATASPSSITLGIGKTTALPSVSAALGTADTWPTGSVPVAASPTWSSGDTSVARIENGKVKGVKEGSTKLTAKVSVAGTTVKASVAVKVSKAANPMKVSGLTAKVGYSKKKARTVKAGSAYRFSKKAAGTVTYSRVKKGSSKWLPKVNPKTGAITVKAGAPKGKTQSVKVRVTAKGNASYQVLSKTVTVKVKVK